MPATTVRGALWWQPPGATAATTPPFGNRGRYEAPGTERPRLLRSAINTRAKDPTRLSLPGLVATLPL